MSIEINPEKNRDTITFVNFNGEGDIILAHGNHGKDEDGNETIINKIIIAKKYPEKDELPVKVVLNFQSVSSVDVFLTKLKDIKKAITENTSNVELDPISEHLWYLLDKISDETFTVNRENFNSLKTFYNQVCDIVQNRLLHLDYNRDTNLLERVEPNI